MTHTFAVTARRQLARAGAIALMACAVTAAAQAQLTRARAISPPDCVSPGNILVEERTAPLDQTYMRVRHMGDPGTAENHAQAANSVTWKVGLMTGLALPFEAQRGYRDEPPPVATSAFQLWCNGAGIYINTFEFSHDVPIVGGGPNAAVARDFGVPVEAFRDGSSLVLEATVRVPTLRNQREGVFREGTAQVGLWYYARDTRSGIVLAQLVHLFDNRAPGVNGSGVEYLGTDTFVMFISSPLAAKDALGNPVRFVTYDGAGPQMQYQAPWPEARHFRAVVTPANFRAALEELHARYLPQVSTEPADYQVLSFGVLVEVIPGTGNEDNVVIGASVQDLSLSQLTVPFLQ